MFLPVCSCPFALRAGEHDEVDTAHQENNMDRSKRRSAQIPLRHMAAIYSVRAHDMLYSHLLQYARPVCTNGLRVLLQRRWPSREAIAKFIA